MVTVCLLVAGNRCGPFQWACRSGECINANNRCDGNYDCQDYSDETGCAGSVHYDVTYEFSDAHPFYPIRNRSGAPTRKWHQTKPGVPANKDAYFSWLCSTYLRKENKFINSELDY